MTILKSLSIIAVVFLIFSPCVFAQGKSETLPGNPLYQAKREMETALLNAELDPLGKAKLHTEYAKERLQEVKTMVLKGKPEFVEGLAEDYEKAVGGAMDEINKARAQGLDVSKALEVVESVTKKHTKVLAGLLGKVPEQAKPAITHAIEVSRRGRNRGKPESTGRPTGIPRGGPSGL